MSMRLVVLQNNKQTSGRRLNELLHCASQPRSGSGLVAQARNPGSRIVPDNCIDLPVIADDGRRPLEWVGGVIEPL